MTLLLFREKIIVIMKAQVNLARRQGQTVTTESKYGAGGNTQKGTSLNTVTGFFKFFKKYLFSRMLIICSIGQAGPGDGGVEAQDGGPVCGQAHRPGQVTRFLIIF